MIKLPRLKKKSSKDARFRNEDGVPDEIIIAFRTRDVYDGDRDIVARDDYIHTDDYHGDCSSHDIYPENKFSGIWQREVVDLEDKLEYLVEQAKRQDELLLQIWTKLKSRTTDPQLDQLEQSVSHFETTIAENKRLEAENEQLTRFLLQCCRSSQTSVSTNKGWSVVIDFVKEVAMNRKST